MMNPNILGIYIEKKDAFLIINVAIITGDKTFKACYGRQDSITEYAVDRILHSGKVHTEEIARAMFPTIDESFEYDTSYSQLQEKLNLELDQLSSLYEEGKDCLNMITLSKPEEQRLVSRLHEIIRMFRDRIAVQLKA